MRSPRVSAALRALLLAAAVESLHGCGSGQGGTPGTAEPAAGTRLEVVNRASVDMDVFAIRGGHRVRVGLAPGNETTVFQLSPAQIVGVGLVYFQAVPRLGNGRPIASEPEALNPKETITLTIPPF